MRNFSIKRIVEQEDHLKEIDAAIGYCQSIIENIYIPEERKTIVVKEKNRLLEMRAMLQKPPIVVIENSSESDLHLLVDALKNNEAVTITKTKYPLNYEEMPKLEKYDSD